MTVRNRHLCETADRAASAIRGWLLGHLHPPGRVSVGDRGVRPGVDVEYATSLVGPPTLAVIVPAPGDTYGQLCRTIDDCLASGVSVVWVINRHWRTVTTYRPDAKPALFNDDQTIPEHPAMPGFAPAVRDLFE